MRTRFLGLALIALMPVHCGAPPVESEQAAGGLLPGEPPCGNCAVQLSTSPSESSTNSEPEPEPGPYDVGYVCMQETLCDFEGCDPAPTFLCRWAGPLATAPADCKCPPGYLNSRGECVEWVRCTSCPARCYPQDPTPGGDGNSGGGEGEGEEDVPSQDPPTGDDDEEDDDNGTGGTNGDGSSGGGSGGGTNEGTGGGTGGDPGTGPGGGGATGGGTSCSPDDTTCQQN